jgi:hypothetical protein
VASEIVVNLISGAGGLAAGLLAPWARWAVEKRRRREDRRVVLITNWRNDIRQLRLAETHHLALNAENRNNHLPEVPEPPEADPTQHEWFRTLELELSDDAARRVDELRHLPIHERKGQKPDVPEEEVRRIERVDWKLL